MKIIKKDYSSKPWRLVGKHGEIWEPQAFTHPILGETVIDGPVAGDTKQELIDIILGKFEAMRDALLHIRAVANVEKQWPHDFYRMAKVFREIEEKSSEALKK